MKTRRYLTAGYGILLMCLVAGCATPERRIRQNPALFASFPAQVQENVRKGMIEVGYTHDMVRIALGLPDFVYERSVEGGKVEIWAYTATQFTSSYVPVDASYWYRTREGRLHIMHDWAWVDVSQRHEYDVMRVEFSNDKVTAIERLR